MQEFSEVEPACERLIGELFELSRDQPVRQPTFRVSRAGHGMRGQLTNRKPFKVGTDHFFEVFVDTPMSVCEQRDPKGMYAKTRRGEIEHLTGIDDAYERPEKPEFILDTLASTAKENARLTLGRLIEAGFVARPYEG
jgi:hypothetical protein